MLSSQHKGMHGFTKVRDPTEDSRDWQPSLWKQVREVGAAPDIPARPPSRSEASGQVSPKPRSERHRYTAALRSWSRLRALRLGPPAAKCVWGWDLGCVWMHTWAEVRRAGNLRRGITGSATKVSTLQCRAEACGAALLAAVETASRCVDV